MKCRCSVFAIAAAVAMIVSFAAGAPDNAARSRTTWPLDFVANGTVTDASGKPMEGVTVRAATGWGTLMGGGTTTTSADGHYTLRFGPGMRTKDAPGGVGFQAASIFATKPGYVERNLSRQGDCRMAGSAEEAAKSREAFDKGPPRTVFLPGQPRQLDFVMLPASTVTGRMVDPAGKPVAKRMFSITGKDLPPSSGAYDNQTTDEQGRFSFERVPDFQPMWFKMDYDANAGRRDPKYVNLKTAERRFSPPDKYEVELVLDFNGEKLTLK